MVEVSQESGVAVLRLSAPPLNLLTQNLRGAIREAAETAEADPRVRAIVLTGAPQFCAGADLKEFGARSDPAVAEAHCRNGHAMTLRLVSCDKPVIAAIEGACLGGGLEIALCCDLRIAARNAKLGLPEIKRGIFPGTGGIPLLERLIGPVRTKSLVLAGDIFEAASPLADGIVDQRTEPGASLATALEAAHRLAAQPAGSAQAIKRLADAEFRSRLAARLDAELTEYVAAYRRADAQEGWRSFLEKRPAVWAHS
jgi:enoyl-CoA hydratase/carnithine racemase